MKKVFAVVFAAFFACMLLAGCSVETQEEAQDSGGNQYYLYYVNKDETKVVSAEYTPEKESAEFLLADLTDWLNSRQGDGTNLALLPDDVQISDYSLEENVLNVVFTTAYSSLSRAREILVRVGAARTYLQIPGITGVQFFVGENELTDSKGQAVGVLNSASFVELGGTDRDAYRSDTFTLYFTDSTGEKLVPEQRTVSYKRSLPREKVILSQLAKGPMEKDHYPTLPESVEILGVTVSDGVCYVNFDENFVDAALDLPSKTVIYSVVNSLLVAGSAEKVEILIDGETEVNFGEEDVSLYNFYGWNADLIAEDGAQ